jgi:hypothetical protein
MGLVFIKINWILKSPYTICHMTKKTNLEMKIDFFGKLRNSNEMI